METPELIKEVSVSELHRLIGEKSIVDIINIYMRRTETFKEEFRAVYRIDGQLYDSIHIFYDKVSEIKEKGLTFHCLEPNSFWGKAETVQEAFKSAIRTASMIQSGSKEAMEAIMLIWNTISTDYALVRKDSITEDSDKDDQTTQNQKDDNLVHWYKKGWDCVLNCKNYNRTIVVSENELENKAFHLGAISFMDVDDVSIADLKSDEDILETIKNSN